MTNPRRNPLKSFAMNSVRKALRAAPGWNGRWSLLHTRRFSETRHRWKKKLPARHSSCFSVTALWPEKSQNGKTIFSRGRFSRLNSRKWNCAARSGAAICGRIIGDAICTPGSGRHDRTINNEQSTMNESLPVVVNACDPANPYGLGIEIGSAKAGANIRIARLPLNYFVFDRGSPVLWIEGFGARITTVAESSQEIVRAGLEQFVSNLRSSFRTNARSSSNTATAFARPKVRWRKFFARSGFTETVHRQ